MNITGYEENFSANDTRWKDLGINKKEMTDQEFELEVLANKVKNMTKVLTLIYSGENTFVNDHNKKTETLQAVVMLDNSHVCPVGIHSFWCLNKLYIGKDEKIHLSAVSVGGSFGVCNSRTDGSKESFMENSVKYYNDNAAYSPKITEYRII